MELGRVHRLFFGQLLLLTKEYEFDLYRVSFKTQYLGEWPNLKLVRNSKKYSKGVGPDFKES